MLQQLRLAVKEAAELILEEGHDASCGTVVLWDMLRASCSISSVPYSATLAKRR